LALSLGVNSAFLFEVKKIARMKAIFVESSLPNVSKNFVLKNIGILSDKYMSLIRETLKYCLADLFRK